METSKNDKIADNNITLNEPALAYTYANHASAIATGIGICFDDCGCAECLVREEEDLKITSQKFEKFYAGRPRYTEEEDLCRAITGEELLAGIYKDLEDFFASKK